MEWNSARLKHANLSAPAEPSAAEHPAAAESGPAPLLGAHGFGELCRLGFALTWPVALAVLLGAGALAVLLWQK
jgi:hypothetical protein